MRASWSRTALLGLGLVLQPLRASAETICGSIAEFNDTMATNATSSDDVTLTYDVTGVNPSDFHNSKGSLGQMWNSACPMLGQNVALKVYGTADVYNAAHPPGTLKMEYGNQCCGGVCAPELWADPNASAVIFQDGGEHCTVKMWVKPDSIGYQLVCESGTYDGLGENPEHNVVDHVQILELTTADGGTTWELPNAVATNVQVCFVTSGPGASTMTVPVAEDVTTGPTHAGVYPDVTDLAVEAADNEAYLKFVVPESAGRVTQARLFLRSRPESFAAGDGGEVVRVASNAWSESTLTWSTRPAHSGASFGRIGPAAADEWLSLDISAAITLPGTYSFAVTSPATDTNGTHFHSKESSATYAPYLRLVYVYVDADGDGSPEGPDCDDADPAVRPGAAEACNGGDDNCDGVTDEGCSPAQPDASVGGTPDAGGPGIDDGDTDPMGSCGCVLRGRATAAGGWLAALVVAGGLLARRRRR